MHGLEFELQDDDPIVDMTHINNQNAWVCGKMPKNLLTHALGTARQLLEDADVAASTRQNHIVKEVEIHQLECSICKNPHKYIITWKIWHRPIPQVNPNMSAIIARMTEGGGRVIIGSIWDIEARLISVQFEE